MKMKTKTKTARTKAPELLKLLRERRGQGAPEITHQGRGGNGYGGLHTKGAFHEENTPEACDGDKSNTDGS